MLRWLVGLLLLVNAGYFAWSQGYLAPLGLAQHGEREREPQRLQAQINPDSVRLLNVPRPTSEPKASNPSPKPSETAKATPVAPPSPTKPLAPEPPQTPATAPTRTLPAAPPTAPVAADARACWLAGSFTESQADTLRAALALLDLPRGTWQLNESRSGGRWIVYMGRYDNAAQVERKKAELRALNVAFRDVSSPGLSPGLALGTYSSEAAAEQAIQNAARSGVRTARVVQDRAESTSFSLRLPNATPAQRNAVAGLGAVLADKPLRPCN